MRLQLQRFSFLTSPAARIAALATVGLAALAAAGAAQAGSNVYWSVGVAAPGIQVGVASAPPVDAALAAVTATGFLAVGEWTPAALVVVDGVAWGETPILKRKLPVGSHTVVQQDPLDRAVVHRETVEIVAGETARVLPR